MKNTGTISLIPPIISESHVKEKITCIRAHRERLFKVCPEKIDDKLIFHNYGQGGAGWTFLFGCVHESIRQFSHAVNENQALKNKPISVIGAGCYGLLTAIILARMGHSVTIIAKETENLPSHKAAGFFFPRPRKCSTVEETAIFQKTGMESYSAYLQIIESMHPFIKKGAQLLPAYFGMDIDPGFGPYRAQGLISKPEQVTIDFGNGKQYQTMEYRALFMQTDILMQELQRNIYELQIPIIIKQEITDFNEISAPIIFNCTSLGSKKLTGDTRLIPVQGHLVTLTNQPTTDHLRYMINVKVVQKNLKGTDRDELIYYAPKAEGILGITFIRGQDSESANHHEFDRLLQRSKDFFGT